MLSWFLFFREIYQNNYQYFLYSRWLYLNSVYKFFFDFWFIISRRRASVSSLLTLRQCFINQFLVNKNCDTTACSAVFPDLMNTYIVWKLIPIVDVQIISTPEFSYMNHFKTKIKFN